MDFSTQSNISFIKQKIDDLEKITDQDNPLYLVKSFMKQDHG